MASPISLALSLLFGAGQVAVGGWLLAHGGRVGRLRRGGAYLALLIGAWCITSGLSELFVSGMESARRLGGGPTAASFALWRGRADTLLLVATAALALAALAWPLVAHHWRAAAQR